MPTFPHMSKKACILAEFREQYVTDHTNLILDQPVDPVNVFRAVAPVNSHSSHIILHLAEVNSNNFPVAPWVLIGCTFSYQVCLHRTCQTDGGHFCMPHTATKSGSAFYTEHEIAAIYCCWWFPLQDCCKTPTAVELEDMLVIWNMPGAAPASDYSHLKCNVS